MSANGWTGEPPEPSQPGRSDWFAPPENEVGAAVPLTLELVRTTDLALAIRDVVAYSTGFVFKLAVRLRPGGERDARTLHQLLISPFGREAGAAGVLRLEVEYAGGRKATTDDAPRLPQERPAI